MAINMRHDNFIITNNSKTQQNEKRNFSIAFIGTMALAQFAGAQTATPNVNHREANQQKRIEKGVNSGS